MWWDAHPSYWRMCCRSQGQTFGHIVGSLCPPHSSLHIHYLLASAQTLLYWHQYDHSGLLPVWLVQCLVSAEEPHPALPRMNLSLGPCNQLVVHMLISHAIVLSWSLTAWTSIDPTFCWLPKCCPSTYGWWWYQFHFGLSFLHDRITYIHLRSPLLLTLSTLSLVHKLYLFFSCPTSLLVLDSSLSWFLCSKTIFAIWSLLASLATSVKYVVAHFAFQQQRRGCCPSLTGDDLTVLVSIAVSFIMICVSKFYCRLAPDANRTLLVDVPSDHVTEG